MQYSKILRKMLFFEQKLYGTGANFWVPFCKHLRKSFAHESPTQIEQTKRLIEALDSVSQHGGVKEKKSRKQILFV